MNVQKPYLPPQNIISPNAPQSPAQDAAGKAANRLPEPPVAGTQAAHFPRHVADHWVMNPQGRNAARNVLLKDRRIRSNRKGMEKSHGADSAEDDAVEPVFGRELSPEVSLVLNLLRDSSGDDRRSELEELLKARQLSPNDRLSVYMEAVGALDNANLAPGDAGRIRQTLQLSIAEIQSQNRHAIRRFIHNPDEHDAAVEEIAGPIKNLKAVTQRELRNMLNPDSPHTELNRVDVQYQALPLLKFVIKIAGPEHAWKFLAVLRKLTRFEY